MNNPISPIIVALDADAHEMNILHGERYGVDWTYPEREETCGDCGAEFKVGPHRPDCDWAL